ncbi:MAG: HNH endonuclease signature motif containing protein, partial [Acidimicrobiia bacterium]
EVIAVLHDRDRDTPLDVGRKTRRVSPGLRRALRVRDGGCRFPGCSNRRFVDAHHIVHWLQGGETKLPNLALLCRRHHRLVHEEGYRLATPATGVFIFTRPDGDPVPEAPAMEAVAGPAIEERNHREGLTIDPGTCRSLGEGESFDLGMTIDAVLYPELRRRGRTWGVVAQAEAQVQTPSGPSWSYSSLHQPLLESVPEFRRLLDEHLEDFEEVLIGTLFETFTSFVLDARRTADVPLVRRCPEFLAAAVDSGDEAIQRLIASAFIEAVGPWNPETSDFVATWPDSLRREAERHARADLTDVA